MQPSEDRRGIVGLRHHRAQEPELGISGSRHPLRNATLHHRTQPPVHGRHPPQTAGSRHRTDEGVGDGCQAPGFGEAADQPATPATTDNEPFALSVTH